MDELKSHYLYPGALFASAQPHRVTTVLGSCVAVCLWDARHRVGGINHYLLPLWNGEGLPTPKYGNIAIEKLLEKMLGLGCDKVHIKAKIFGGASMWIQSEGLMAVGERNIALAHDMLGDLRIPIISSDVGGQVGRKVIYHTGSGEVLMKRNKGLGQ